MRRIGLLFLCSYLCQFVFAQTNKTINLHYFDEYVVEKNESFIPRATVDPNMISIDSNENIYLCNNNSVFKLNNDGEIVATISAYGRGPGELQSINACTIHERYLLVYDGEKREILFFNKDSLEYEFSHNYERNKRIRSIVSVKGMFIMLHRGSFSIKTPSLSIFQVNEDTLNITNGLNVPKYAYLSASTNGDGLTADNIGNIYYSYLSYPTVWRYNIYKGIVEEINIVTNSYEGFKESEIKRLRNDHIAHIEYNFTNSRVMGLHMLTNNILVRHIEHGNLVEGEDAEIYIDFIDLNTNFLIGSKRIRKRIVFIHDEMIYLEKDEEEVSQKYDRAKIGEDVALFDIYKVEIK